MIDDEYSGRRNSLERLLENLQRSEDPDEQLTGRVLRELGSSGIYTEFTVGVGVSVGPTNFEGMRFIVDTEDGLVSRTVVMEEGQTTNRRLLSTIQNATDSFPEVPALLHDMLIRQTALRGLKEMGFQTVAAMLVMRETVGRRELVKLMFPKSFRELMPSDASISETTKDHLGMAMAVSFLRSVKS